MLVYGYEEVLYDRVNEVMAMVPKWKDIPLKKVMAFDIKSAAIWQEAYVGQEFLDHQTKIDEDTPFDGVGALKRFSEMIIKVDGSWRKYKNILVLCHDPRGLYHFLKNSWKPTDCSMQQEVSELLTNKGSAVIIQELLGKIMDDGSWELRVPRYKGLYGIVLQYQVHHTTIDLDGKRYHFIYPESDPLGTRQIALKVTHQQRNGVDIPTSAMLWGAEGLHVSSGPFVGFWQGRCFITDDLGEFDDAFFETIEKAKMYAQAPWFPMEDDHLQARVLIRIPGRDEALSWLRERSIAMKKRDALNSEAKELICSTKLPEGLPVAGFLKDSRSSLYIPEDIPIVKDIGEVLTILGRTAHGVFVSDRPPQPSLRSLPDSVGHLLGTIAVPRLPFSSGRLPCP